MAPRFAWKRARTGTRSVTSRWHVMQNICPQIYVQSGGDTPRDDAPVTASPWPTRDATFIGVAPSRHVHLGQALLSCALPPRLRKRAQPSYPTRDRSKGATYTYARCPSSTCELVALPCATSSPLCYPCPSTSASSYPILSQREPLLLSLPTPALWPSARITPLLSRHYPVDDNLFPLPRRNSLIPPGIPLTFHTVQYLRNS